MKVVVVIKSGMGGRGTSQAARYIATRERDEAREGSVARPLFSERAADLNHMQANQWLGNGPAPRTDDVLHLVISFHREEDFHGLGTSEESQLDGVRQATRATMKELTKAVHARELRWVAGVHRNTDNPHVHLLIQRDYTEQQTGQTKRLQTLPQAWRVHWEKAPDGTRVTHLGLFSQTFGKHLVHRHQQFQRDQHARDEEERRERALLGKAMLATERIQNLQEQWQKAEGLGAWRRYRIVDAQGRSRLVSEADMRQRDSTLRRQAAAKLSFHPAIELRTSLQHAAKLQEANQHDVVMQKIRAAQNADARAIEFGLQQANQAARPVLDAAQAIKDKYARSVLPLPTPLLSRADLAHLQQRAITRQSAERLKQLEEIRRALAVEKGEPTRTEAEVGRLRAQLFVARSGLQTEQQSQAIFERTKHLRQWRAGGEESSTKRSLAEIEAARTYAADQAKFIGARRLHWDSSARAQAREDADRLSQQRTGVLQQITDERARQTGEIARRTETVSTLDTILAVEQKRYQEQSRPLPAPLFTKMELRELDAHAMRRHDASFYRTLVALERDYDARNPRNAQRAILDRYSRAGAREVMAEIEMRESAARLERFNAQPTRMMVVTHESPATHLKLARLADVELRGPLEEVLRPWLTRTTQYRAVAKAVSAWGEHLQHQHEQNKNTHALLAETAQNYAQELSQRFPGQPLPRPHFTARELNQLELHLIREADPARREHYAQLLEDAMETNRTNDARPIRLDEHEAKDLLAGDRAPLFASASHEHEISFDR